jgi:ribosome-binding factor A
MSGRKREHLVERIRQKLGLLLLREAGDPRFQFVTITEVHLSKDKAHALVRFSCLQPGADVEALTVSLNGAAGFLGQALGRTLETRSTPRLRFVYDPGFDYANEMEILLAKVRIPAEGGP